LHTVFWVAKIKGRVPPGRLGVGGTIKIGMDLQEVGWGNGLDWSGSWWGQVASSCEYGNELIYKFTVQHNFINKVVLDCKFVYFINYWKHNGDASPEKKNR